MYFPIDEIFRSRPPGHLWACFWIFYYCHVNEKSEFVHFVGFVRFCVICSVHTLDTPLQPQTQTLACGGGDGGVRGGGGCGAAVAVVTAAAPTFTTPRGDP